MRELLVQFNSLSIKDKYTGEIATEQPRNVKESWGMDFMPNPLEILGRKIEPISLQARQLPIKVDERTGTFRMKQPITKPVIFTNWILAYSQKDAAYFGDSIVEKLNFAGKIFEIEFKPPEKAIYNNGAKGGGYNDSYSGCHKGAAELKECGSPNSPSSLAAIQIS